MPAAAVPSLGAIELPAVGGALKLKDGVALDYEAGSTVTVAVTATDAGGLSVAQSFTLSVSNANEAPTAISLSTAAVVENAAGAVIGTLSVTDPDAGDTAAYTVDDTRFEVVGGALKLKDGVALDYEAGSTVTVAVTATDAGGLSVAQSFTLSVSNANEAPTDISLSNASVAENAAGAVIGTLSVTDPDAGDTATYTVDDTRFEVVGGALKLKDGVALDYEAGSTVTVAVTATDAGGLSVAQSFTLSVSNANEAPTDISLSNASVTENAAGGTVVGSLLLIDPDAGETATFTLLESAGGKFTLNGSTLVVAGAIDYEAATSHGVTVRATDSAGNAVTKTFTISVADVVETDIVGTVGNDNLIGTIAADNIQALAGDDNVTGGDGDDLINGGDGLDRAIYVGASGGVSISLASGAVVGPGDVDNDTLLSVEFILGSDFNDTFNASGFGASSANAGSLSYRNLDGTLNEFEGMGGDDGIVGNGFTRLSYLNATNGVTVDLFAGTAIGGASAGNDIFSGVNSIRGSNLADTLLGSGNGAGTVEAFEGRGGADTIDGRGGFDRSTYEFEAGTITVNLAAGTVNNGGVIDTIRSIEAIRGTAGADTYQATGFTDTSINAGSAGVNGAGAAFNEFEGMGGNDNITGNGNTRVSYQNASGGVTITFSGGGAGTAGGDASVGTDTFVSGVFNARGSQFGDTLTGAGSNDTLDGQGGNDVINAGGGNDTLIGGSGDDALNGGGGFDVAVFSGSRSIYTFAPGSISGVDGVDTTTGGIELLRFDDAYMLWADAVNVVGVNLAAGLGIFGRGVADDLTVDNVMNGRLINLGGGEDIIRISMGGGTPQSIELNTPNVESIVMAGSNTGSLAVTMTAGTVLNGTTIDLGSFSDALNLSDGSDVVTVIGVETINAGGGNDVVTLVGDGTSPYTVNLGASFGLDVLNLAGTSSDFSLSLSGGTVLVNGQTTGAAGGNESVTLSNERTDTTFDLGAGYDTLQLFSVSRNDIRVRDVEEVSAIGFGRDTVIKEGAGTTTFTLGGGTDFVFAGAGVDRIRFTAVGDSVFEVPTRYNHHMDQITYFDASQDVFVFQGVGGPSFDWDIATYTVQSAFSIGVDQPPLMVDIDILRVDFDGNASGDFGWDMGIDVTGMNGTFSGANIQWIV